MARYAIIALTQQGAFGTGQEMAYSAQGLNNENDHRPGGVQMTLTGEGAGQMNYKQHAEVYEHSCHRHTYCPACQGLGIDCIICYGCYFYGPIRLAQICLAGGVKEEGKC